VNISKERLGQLFILVGPGGAGKNTLMNHILDRFGTLKQLPTATTRPIRPDEQHGREHLFLDVEAFQELIDNNALIEYQEVRPGQYYGVPRDTVQTAIDESNDLIADIEVLGASILREQYPENTTLIFITPPSMNRLAKQMRERGTDEATIKDRMIRAAMEMPFAPLCDHIIINDNLDNAIEELHDIIEQAQGFGQLESVPNHAVHYEVRGLLFNHERDAILEPALLFDVSVGKKPRDVLRSKIEQELSITLEIHQLSQQSPDERVKFYPVSIVHNDDGIYIRYTYAYAMTNSTVALTSTYHWKPITSMDLQ